MIYNVLFNQKQHLFLPDRDKMKIPCGRPDMHLLFEDKNHLTL